RGRVGRRHAGACAGLRHPARGRAVHARDPAQLLERHRGEPELRLGRRAELRRDPRRSHLPPVAPQHRDRDDRLAGARGRAREDVLGVAMLAPALVYVILLVGVPFMLAILLSFSNATAGSLSFGWVGGRNYAAILGDPIFLRSLRNTAIVTIGSQVLVVVLAKTCWASPCWRLRWSTSSCSWACRSCSRSCSASRTPPRGA